MNEKALPHVQRLLGTVAIGVRKDKKGDPVIEKAVGTLAKEESGYLSED